MGIKRKNDFFIDEQNAVLIEQNNMQSENVFRWDNVEKHPLTGLPIEYYGRTFLRLCRRHGPPLIDGVDHRKYKLLGITERVLQANLFASLRGKEFAGLLKRFLFVLQLTKHAYTFGTLEQVGYANLSTYYRRCALWFYNKNTSLSHVPNKLPYPELEAMRRVLLEIHQAIGCAQRLKQISQDNHFLLSSISEDDYNQWTEECSARRNRNMPASAKKLVQLLIERNDEGSPVGDVSELNKQYLLSPQANRKEAAIELINCILDTEKTTSSLGSRFKELLDDFLLSLVDRRLDAEYSIEERLRYFRLTDHYARCRKRIKNNDVVDCFAEDPVFLSFGDMTLMGQIVAQVFDVLGGAQVGIDRRDWTKKELVSEAEYYRWALEWHELRPSIPDEDFFVNQLLVEIVANATQFFLFKKT